jgi:hypothetical protein
LPCIPDQWTLGQVVVDAATIDMIIALADVFNAPT